VDCSRAGGSGPSEFRDLRGPLASEERPCFKEVDSPEFNML
jgi:hypothetical protein